MGLDWIVERLTLENLKEWQTLVSGLLAIVAAICAGGFVLYQTHSQTRVEDRRRLARFEAARMLLPLTLSELIRWTNDIIRSLKALRSSSDRQHLTHDERRVELPPLPLNLIEQLRDLVEHNDDAVFRNYIGSITRKIQMARARLESLNPEKEPNLIVLRSNIDNNIYDFLELSLWLESLFKFARGESNACPKEPDWTRLGTQMDIHNVYGGEDLIAKIRRKMESMAPGDPAKPGKTAGMFQRTKDRLRSEIER